MALLSWASRIPVLMAAEEAPESSRKAYYHDLNEDIDRGRGTDKTPVVDPRSARSRSKIRFAVWRCLRGCFRSSFSHPSRGLCQVKGKSGSVSG